jgi:hypothetical protein
MGMFYPRYPRLGSQPGDFGDKRLYERCAIQLLVWGDGVGLGFVHRISQIVYKNGLFVYASHREMHDIPAPSCLISPIPVFPLPIPVCGYPHKAWSIAPHGMWICAQRHPMACVVGAVPMVRKPIRINGLALAWGYGADLCAGSCPWVDGYGYRSAWPWSGMGL